MLVITSQNCDIACRTDSDDSCIEIAVFKKINRKKVFPGNQFVKSVRKLHINVDENWYEAKVAYIFVVDKIQLLELFSKIGAINYLPEEHLKAIPLWRANRYLRTALPDNLDHEFKQVVAVHFNVVRFTKLNIIRFGSFMMFLPIYCRTFYSLFQIEITRFTKLHHNNYHHKF